MIAVVEEGTARSGRLTGLQIAGKTGTAQNPHGASHGLVHRVRACEKPEIVVGAIIEFASTAPRPPIVSRKIAHYLGLEETAATRLRVTVPTDSAPRVPSPRAAR